ncbi:CubicO group peptidase (beta-lactamase class C family) [Micromonospora profundi]|uniref:serine hydrolase domain-containing protein n=1 Tax=Micromonospora TaxID=1873 RepID=UPI0006AE6EED|nr:MULTISPECIES: serine hydrolase domain-containing protein [Micromonospora]KOX08066.1 beta-lactamase [Micromonospora sp. NRRL B-16802]NJC11675.1 CubicO group peptidase (beta-lactamase class C family) [Micromonospora profundi]
MPVARRTLLGAGLAAATSALAGCGDKGSSAPGLAGSGDAVTATDAAGNRVGFGSAAAPSGSPSATASPSGGAAQAGQARYAQDVTALLRKQLPATGQTVQHKGFPGAVAVVLVDGKTTVHTAVGEALRYGAGPKLLPPGQRVAMRPDSIFDLASVTKVYTAILLLQQVDKGRVALDAPVRDYLPAFAGTGKERITVGMLLTHTSGLPVGAKVTGLPDNAARWNAVLTTGLVSGAVPGDTFRYSSVGLMVAGRIVEKVTGQRLDQALKSNLTGPLGLRDTGFNPNTWLSGSARASRLVATDARSSRGLLRGTVHDDVANHLGGVAGHAGIFASATDLAVIGQMLLNGGTYQGRRILAAATVRRMLSNQNAGKPAVDPERPNRTAAHGLGVVLDQRWFMGRLAAPRTFGHTGFAGPSLLVDPRRRLVLALLTNRAHPNWSWANPDPVRAAVGDLLAREVN